MELVSTLHLFNFPQSGIYNNGAHDLQNYTFTLKLFIFIMLLVSYLYIQVLFVAFCLQSTI